ncbi:hypothetical protein [Sciscionella marina]|uniref:hypothetical protein n=1 Tax=Sciscionella marina TaxID=508770 RepID=UPI0003703681|nr:hypothetical protein [Sciscionella marina]
MRDPLRSGHRVLAIAVSAAILLLLGSPASAAQPPANPWLGPAGSATMHGDAESSDTTTAAGPGTGPVRVQTAKLGAACPTVLAGRDGFPVALCTTQLGRTPTVFLLDPETTQPLTRLALPKGSLLSGVYAYLDNRDRLVFVDGANELVRVAHQHTSSGWRLSIAERTPLGSAIPEGDGVSSLMPDWRGRVWFGTNRGTVGVLDGSVAHTVRLGEQIANSISTAPGATAVATTHALYRLSAGPDGVPHVDWRVAYERGPGRKPGQLSWGTGASPTFFGPRTGTEYLAITDNAAPEENLVVVDARTGAPVCTAPSGLAGTELSPVASGDSVYLASTYGYPYPALPEGAGPSTPLLAPFTGGMTRIDVHPGGCATVWRNPERSAAVPRLSTADGKLYTITRQKPAGGARGSTLFDHYEAAVIDAKTGRASTAGRIGSGFFSDTLQMVGSIVPGRVQYQGTVNGVVAIRPAGAVQPAIAR